MAFLGAVGKAVGKHYEDKLRNKYAGGKGRGGSTDASGDSGNGSSGGSGGAADIVQRIIARKKRANGKGR